MTSNQSSNNTNLVERLFKVGAHFGFSKSRRHPSIAKYIFTHKDGTDIFDLEKTATLLSKAQSILAEAGKEGKTVLFVGTKAEASVLVKQAAEKAHMPFVTNRWIGGMLTNFSEIRKRIDLLKSLQSEKESGELDRKYTKKERVVINRNVKKLQFNFLGISEMNQLPHLMLVVDPRHDAIAVQEARDIGIPVIAIMSSDCNAEYISHPVPVNDSQTASIQFALQELVQGYLTGKESFVPAAVRTMRTESRPVRTTRARHTTSR